MKEKFSLKDALFNHEQVSYLADLFVAVDARFPKNRFVTDVVAKFPELELKARIQWIAEILARYLPTDVPLALNLIVRALPPELDITKTDDDFGEFILAPLGEYVVRNACVPLHVEQALDTLYEITKRFSMEDAMRAFIHTFPNETLARYDEWVRDSNYHVRRLVSESTRPQLPWSKRLTLDYQVPLDYLNVLHQDKTRYVTRSVANHLNDISKKDAPVVLAVLARWKTEGKQSECELAWLTKHALRTLVKKGNLDALKLLGFEFGSKVTISDFITDASTYVCGNTMHFSFTIESAVPAKLLIDYVIDFVKANGTTKPKVFKLKSVDLTAGETVILTKTHHLKADATTFTMYPGVHTLTLQINGMAAASLQFTVT